MINSHRLLVRGHRVAVEQEEISASLSKCSKQNERPFTRDWFDRCPFDAVFGDGDKTFYKS